MSQEGRPIYYNTNIRGLRLPDGKHWLGDESNGFPESEIGGNKGVKLTTERPIVPLKPEAENPPII